MVIQGVSYPSDFEAKKAIISAAAVLSGKGSMPAGDGSISVRVGPNAVWITVDGADKAALSQDMMVRVDLSGRQSATNKPKPLGCDLETHLRLYRENDNIRSVIHAYPVRAVRFSAENRGLEPASFTPAIRRLGRLRLVSAPDPEQAAENIALCAKSDHGALIKNEGCMMWGRSAGEVLSFFETLDYYCKAIKYIAPAAAQMTDPSVSGSCEGECVSCSSKTVCGSCHGECSVCPVSKICGKYAQNRQAAAANADPEKNCSYTEAGPVSMMKIRQGDEIIGVPSVLPKGMTGIIRPGSPLPALPEETELRGESEGGAAGKEASLSQNAYSPVTDASVSGGRASDAAGGLENPRHPSAALSAVINTPKSAVITEVVRRTVS